MKVSLVSEIKVLLVQKGAGSSLIAHQWPKCALRIAARQTAVHSYFDFIDLKVLVTRARVGLFLFNRLVSPLNVTGFDVETTNEFENYPAFILDAILSWL